MSSEKRDRNDTEYDELIHDSVEFCNATEPKRPRSNSTFEWSSILDTKWLNSYSRPQLPSSPSLTQDSLTFMHLDTDFVPSTSTTFSAPNHPPIPSGSAVVRIFGVTSCGTSILARIHGFLPYLFIQAPSSIQRYDPELIASLINKRMMSNSVISVSFEKRRSILYYVPGDPILTFLKITVRSPRDLKTLMNFTQSGLKLDEEITLPAQTFEGNVDFVMRFMVDTHVSGCCWIHLKKGEYVVTNHSSRLSSMQVEIDAHFSAIHVEKSEGEWLKSAPLRRLSFDIECAGRKGIFPEPEHDQVIQIGNVIQLHGISARSCVDSSQTEFQSEHDALESGEQLKIVFTLDSCAPIVGALVKSYRNEVEMLRAWAQFVRAIDPDVLTGYNIVNFDLPFLLNRAKRLSIAEFPYLGRIHNKATTMRDTKMSSSAFGTHESKEFSIDGRVILDVMQLITREYKLRSYSLNSVSAEFLGEQKEDVHYSIISDLQAGTSQNRRRLAVYCLKDALLPQRLLDRLLFLTNYIEMARVTGIPLSWLVSRGHMVKVVSLLHRKAFAVDLVVPDIQRNSGLNPAESSTGAQYEGATVIEPEKGFYTQPVATLDFASLYPSIMMAHNLCYSTLIRREDRMKIGCDDYITTPCGDTFVKSSVKKGVLSSILEELIAARKVAKKELELERDAFKKSVLNARQLALKISANAVYGFTGASVGKLPCMEISASTTAFGRDMIQYTKCAVETLYPDAKVIYGDTDSVMVYFEGKSLSEAMKLGELAAEEITKSFPKPVKLEFEKCYYPYLLISKKRYAGLYWTNTEKYDKMDCKGIESVRRDNCRLVANMISIVLDKLLIQKDVDGCMQFVKHTISELLQNKIDLSLLVVSKALSKSESKYDSKQAHVVLAEKMRARDAGNAPSLGDRVPYVITKGRKGQAAYERAEDPLYVLEHNIPIDNQYYLDNMLRKPLERIFEAILKNPAELFSGAHTRSIAVATPSTGLSGGLMKFASVSLTCLGCRTPIKNAKGSSGADALCKSCKSREAEIYLKLLHSNNQLERSFAALWTECQRCMGDICQDVLCSNSDCPIFYRRCKVAKDLESNTAKLSRFQLEW